MRMLAALAVAASLSVAPAALAQQDLVIVNLTEVNADLAAQLGIDGSTLPPSIALAADSAANV